MVCPTTSGSWRSTATPADDDAYRAHARGKLDAHLPDRDDKAADALLERLSYRAADVTSADDLRSALDGAATPMAVYLALPNVLFRPTLQALAGAGLPAHTTLVVEKPFGADLADAKALNELIAESFDERDVFRIDHFLAKQTVLDVLGLRFANRIFDPVWNSNHVKRVDITWYESLGLEGRASYYDRAGALRDMIQNHLLQMLALVAMDPPRSITERDLRDRKVEVLRAVTPPKPEEMAKATRRARYTAGTIAGSQLPAYADEEGVDPSRDTETYAEVTFRVSNWRWAGTPFRLRTGKAIGTERREIAVHFKSVPHEPFDDRDRPNVLRFQLSPDAISLQPQPQRRGRPLRPGAGQRSTREFPTQELPPYSLLLKEILEGDADPVHPRRRGRGAVADRRAGAAAPGPTTRCRSRSTPRAPAGPSGARVPEQAAADEERGAAPGDDPTRADPPRHGARAVRLRRRPGSAAAARVRNARCRVFHDRTVPAGSRRDEEPGHGAGGRARPPLTRRTWRCA